MLSLYAAPTTGWVLSGKSSGTKLRPLLTLRERCRVLAESTKYTSYLVDMFAAMMWQKAEPKHCNRTFATSLSFFFLV